MASPVPLKWHGGKAYLATKIVALMPKHTHYVEPFCGGCAVLLARPLGQSELVNDLNKLLMNWWRVMQDEDQFAKFKRRMEAMPLSRIEWDSAVFSLLHADQPDPITMACWFFVACRQSLAGRMNAFTPPTRTRTRRGMNGNVSEWLTAVDGLQAVHERLRSVFLESMDGKELIEREDTLDTLFYCDPPYLLETRATKSVYQYEMNDGQHMSLLDTLKQCKGKVILSGYQSELYNTALTNWNQKAFDLPNNAAGGKTKRRASEVLWMNF